MPHNTREGIKIVKEVDLLLQEGKYIEAMDLFLTTYKEQQELHHHQIQKARDEGFEAGMLVAEEQHTGRVIHSELDQDKK